MLKRKKFTSDEGGGVPQWIVSFSDMITLLLAFFVLLQAFASARDPELFYAGQGSFRRATQGFGMSTWQGGRKNVFPEKFRKLKYPTKAKKPHQDSSRLIDLEDEKIRQTFRKLQSDMSVIASDVAEQSISIFPTAVIFGQSETDISEQGRQCITGFCLDLKQSRGLRPTKVYVIGLAADEKSRRRQWIVSARRARNAEMFVRRVLADEVRTGQWDTYSWGAGAGGEWCQAFGLIPKQTYIVLAIMSVKD